jgi:hypothetical protein
MVVMMVGGPSSSLVAFYRQNGSVVWKKHDFRNSTSSPIIINVDGQDQLVAFMYAEIVGVDPNNGNLLWTRPHPAEFGLNTSTPIWGPDNLLFMSSGYGGGSRVLRLSRTRDKTTVEEVWANSLMRIHFTDSRRRFDLRIERRFWTGAFHRGKRQNGKRCVAPSQFSKSVTPVCGWPFHYSRRRRSFITCYSDG